MKKEGEREPMFQVVESPKDTKERMKDENKGKANCTGNERTIEERDMQPDEDRFSEEE